MRKVIDLTGKTFGELTVLRRAGSDHGATWVCLCSCGVECVKLGHKMVSGHTKTCGHSKAKTLEEMREYKLSWYHANKAPLSGEHKNQNTDKTHCIRGHEFTRENTGFKDGHRLCITCRNYDARLSATLKRQEMDNKPPEERAAYYRKRRRTQLIKIGWTPERYEERLVEQNNKCAICKKEMNQRKDHNQAVAHADHAHTNPPIARGLLCGNCNLGIGNLQESPEIMLAAVAYIKKWKEG